MKPSKKISEFIKDICKLDYEIECANNEKYFNGILPGEKWLSIPTNGYNNAFDSVCENWDFDDKSITQFYLATLEKAKYASDDEKLTYLTKLTSIIRAEIEEEIKESK